MVEVDAKLWELSRSWGIRNAEVKGRDLDEAQVAAVLGLLAHADAIAELTVIDLGTHTPTAVCAHKHRQADGVVAELTPEHRPTLVAEVREIESTLRKMPARYLLA
jgi:hypothetical protein